MNFPTRYSHPDSLVSTQWLADHLHSSGIVVIESNEDLLLYGTGHVPGAHHIDWRQDLNREDDIIVYCRIGERSSLTWFVLTHPLGHQKVRNYDGSWTEWGNRVRSPIETGDSHL